MKSCKSYLLFILMVFFSQGYFAHANTVTGQNDGQAIYTAQVSGDGKSLEIHTTTQAQPTNQQQQPPQPAPAPAPAPAVAPIPNFFAPPAPATPPPPLVITPVTISGVQGEWFVITQNQVGSNPVFFGVTDGTVNFQATLDFLNEEDDAGLPAANLFAVLQSPQVVAALNNLLTHPLITSRSLRYSGWGTLTQNIIGPCLSRWGYNRAEFHTVDATVPTQVGHTVLLGDNLAQTTTDTDGDVVIETVAATAQTQSNAGKKLKVVALAPNSYEATGIRGIPLYSCKGQAFLNKSDRKDDDDEGPDKTGPSASRSSVWGYFSGMRIVTMFSRGGSKQGGETKGGGSTADKKQDSVDNKYTTTFNDSTPEVDLYLPDEPANLMQLKVELDLSFPGASQKHGVAGSMEAVSEKGTAQSGFQSSQPATMAY